jgi:uncharacterized membrane protein
MLETMKSETTVGRREAAVQDPAPIHRRFVWLIGFLTTIALLVVARRVFVLLQPPIVELHGPIPDGGFVSHRGLTLAHILPGLAYLLLAPAQFSSHLRAKRPEMHRRLGRVTLVAGLITGLTALRMTTEMAIGGANETAAILLFGSLFLLSLGCGYREIRNGRREKHREWMIRAYSIGLAIATIRPIVGIFFATSRLTGLTQAQFFGTAFWIGFTLHLIAAQWWIDATRTAPLHCGHVRAAGVTGEGGTINARS